MAALPVEIRGTLYDLASKSSRQVYIVGEAVRSDVGVGGGPLPGGGGEGIWGGGNVPMPSPPIAGVPGAPGYQPPGQGGSPPGFWGGGPHPMPPINYPEGGPPGGGQPPTDTVPGGDKPPPATGGWGYVAQWSDGSPGGWGMFPAASDKPNPPG